MPTPRSVSSPTRTSSAAQTKSQAGVTGNACCLVGEGGEGNLTTKSHYVGNMVNIACPSEQCSTTITICDHTFNKYQTIFCPSWEWQSTPSVTSHSSPVAVGHFVRTRSESASAVWYVRQTLSVSAKGGVGADCGVLRLEAEQLLSLK